MISDPFDHGIAKILALFATSPGSAFLRKELKEKTFLHNVSLDNALAALCANRILEKQRRLFRVNFHEKAAKVLLALFTEEYARFKEIPLKVFFLLMEISSSLCRESQVKHILLFGSYAKLVYRQDSDIDLAIITDGDDEKIKSMVKKGAEMLEEKFEVVVEAHFFSEKDLQAKDPLIHELKRNNVPLF